MSDNTPNDNETENGSTAETPQNTENDKPAFKVVKTLSPGVEEQAGLITESIPEVTESAIDVHNVETEKIEQAAHGLKDRNGKTFDPAIHLTNPDGTPKVSDKTGKLLLKRGRKSSGATSTPKSTVKIPGAQAVTDGPQMSEAQLQQAKVTGSVAASMLFNVSMMIGGKEFAPNVDPVSGIDERAAMESAFADYFIATGKTDFPPGVALTLTISMYILPRFMLPTVQTNIKAKGGKLYTWWQNRKLKKQQKKAAKDNGTQSDTRHDGKRENDTSETTSASLQT